jgi:hypothetical protein
MADWVTKDEELVVKLDDLLADAVVTRKSFFGNVAWFIDSNDQIFVQTWGVDIALRLGSTNTSILIDSQQMSEFNPSGHRPKQEYVLLSQRQHSSDEYLLNWLELAIEYVESLPPKPKKKSRKGS